MKVVLSLVVVLGFVFKGKLGVFFRVMRGLYDGVTILIDPNSRHTRFNLKQTDKRIPENIHFQNSYTLDL